MSVCAALAERERSVGPSGDDVDYLASQYLEAEREVAEAYRRAHDLDEKYERIKAQLLFAAEEFGDADGDERRVLRGHTHQITVLQCLSTVPDQTAIDSFAFKLRVNRRCSSITPEVFRKKTYWILRDEAEAFLQRYRLPDDLQAMYRKCRKVESTPTLEVVVMFDCAQNCAR